MLGLLGTVLGMLQAFFVLKGESASADYALERAVRRIVAARAEY